MRPTPHWNRLDRAFAALLVLNLADALFTLGWIEAGWATEANPLMAAALAWGPAAFVGTKLLLVSLAVQLLARQPGLRIIQPAAMGLLALYVGINTSHVQFAISRLV